MATSSPMRAGASLAEELDYYKKQYEQLETDLADFQASSKELEEQLERDIEAAEKKERKLKEQVEKLGFEVEEWKTKHRQAKAEANGAQNALQKEITTMRETNRSLQLKLRDTEVINDDYERQARNTESSLEDLESKYNVAIERSVLLEEEVKVGEQEREALRIETQRLRDELGDLKVESEITLEKLRLADNTIERLRSRKPSPLAVEYLRAKSPGSEASGRTLASPTASTPPPKSDTMSDAPTPPSPPLSDAPTHAKAEQRTPLPSKRKSFVHDATSTLKPGLYGPRTAPKHSRGPSIASSNGNSASDSVAMRPPASRPKRPSVMPSEGLPRSESLYQIKALRGRMQKIEERVQSARSKLPPPGTRTPTGSPRNVSGLGGADMPSSVTVRRSARRPSGSATSSLVNDGTVDGITATPTSRREKRPPSSAMDRPPSAFDRPTFVPNRPPSAAAASRPSSRASMSSAGFAASDRPASRAGARTPLPQYGTTTGQPSMSTPGKPEASKPRTSMGGMYATMHGTLRSHRPSASVSELRRKAAESEDSTFISTPSRRTTMDRTALSTPNGLSKQHIGGSGDNDGAMRPPPRRKASDLGETY
ncbi:hypothetical protein BAUCODRAFT_112182 [Baudoinia panamericana UAMH 10762]|uniref:NUDE domain-containing protein n=1 Tax=Baudoinia panamericana (strain UAMH 10762) TaxID=717646 RepID=M2MB78_BAUPA|nr:uncharacterized protein BAUCODRAFT_112182 [Baudoinia panamericana UAMH 10762]EMC93741.1 hypothetical protein BAUCODRAFT_112182 [Baudoinia panamericana UAMH 10762]